jgi:hypothetical protein
MSRSWARGQVEPTAALVVLLAVTAAVSTYAVTLHGATPVDGRDVAAPTLDRVLERLAVGGVVEPSRTRRAHGAGPPRYRLNLTVAAAGHRWDAGPTPPTGTHTDTASRPIGVSLGPGRIRSGRVRVEVWV